jgi:oligopeptide transport system ATP-binding protein
MSYQHPLVSINDLHVDFTTYGGVVKAVSGVSVQVNQGEILAIVGESGSGKSVTAKAIMGLIPSPPGKISAGSIFFNGTEISNYSQKEMESIRGRDIGMIFQDPMSSLNPTMRIGAQITEGLIKHFRLNRNQAHERAIELLRAVEIPNPEIRIDQYPHQLSGGMRQRVVIAIAIACKPKLLIADEPTTALDVSVQAQILTLLKSIRKQEGSGMILITHDLAVVAGMADRVAVMYAGKIVETADVDTLFANPRHPYTKALLQAIPKIGHDQNQPLKAIRGSPPDLLNPPPGCSFCPRCENAMKICDRRPPPLQLVDQPHQQVACWLEEKNRITIREKRGGQNG